MTVPALLMGIATFDWTTALITFAISVRCSSLYEPASMAKRSLASVACSSVTSDILRICSIKLSICTAHASSVVDKPSFTSEAMNLSDAFIASSGVKAGDCRDIGQQQRQQQLERRLVVSLQHGKRASLQSPNGDG